MNAPFLSVVVGTGMLAVGLAQGQASSPAAKDVLPAITPEVCRGIDTKLVSLGTRHTLSDAKADGQGVGAARRWIKSELESYNKDGGKLEVSFEEFIAPKG